MIYFTLVTIVFSFGETMDVNLVHKYLVEILEILGSMLMIVYLSKKRQIPEHIFVQDISLMGVSERSNVNRSLNVKKALLSQVKITTFTKIITKCPYPTQQQHLLLLLLLQL